MGQLRGVGGDISIDLYIYIYNYTYYVYIYIYIILCIYGYSIVKSFLQCLRTYMNHRSCARFIGVVHVSQAP